MIEISYFFYWLGLRSVNMIICQLYNMNNVLYRKITKRELEMSTSLYPNFVYVFFELMMFYIIVLTSCMNQNTIL